MIEIYTRDGCNSCSQVKAIMNYYGLNYAERKLDVDVTSEWVHEHFPGKNALPILIVNGEIFSGPQESSKVLNEYRREVGKQLLNENENGNENGNRINDWYFEGGQ